ncbi:hypothetical protein Aduo_016843 [Ancylostoma duodenale]
MDKHTKTVPDGVVDGNKASDQTTPAEAATPEKLPTPPPSPVEDVEEHFEVKKISPDTSDKAAGESAKHDENVSPYVSVVYLASILVSFLDRLYSLFLVRPIISW